MKRIIIIIKISSFQWFFTVQLTVYPKINNSHRITFQVYYNNIAYGSLSMGGCALRPHSLHSSSTGLTTTTWTTMSMRTYQIYWFVIWFALTTVLLSISYIFHSIAVPFVFKYNDILSPTTAHHHPPSYPPSNVQEVLTFYE